MVQNEWFESCREEEHTDELNQEKHTKKYEKAIRIQPLLVLMPFHSFLVVSEKSLSFSGNTSRQVTPVPVR